MTLFGSSAHMSPSKMQRTIAIWLF